MSKKRKCYRSRIERKIKKWNTDLPMYIMNLNCNSGQTVKIYSKETAKLLTTKGWYYLC